MLWRNAARVHQVGHQHCTGASAASLAVDVHGATLRLPADKVEASLELLRRRRAIVQYRQAQLPHSDPLVLRAVSSADG